jgi:hypothetical protein
VRFDAATLHDLRSVSKSVTGALFGIAVAADAIHDLDAPVLSYFPEYKELHTRERLRTRLRDVLSMASGLQWDEESRPYGDPLNSETAMDAANDRCRYVLSRPIAAAPGEKFRYSGGDMLLLAAVLERVTKLRLDKYAERVARYSDRARGLDEGVPHQADTRVRSPVRVSELWLSMVAWHCSRQCAHPMDDGSGLWRPTHHAHPVA